MVWVVAISVVQVDTLPRQGVVGAVVVMVQNHKTVTPAVQVVALVTSTPQTLAVPVLLIKATLVVTVLTAVHLSLLPVVEVQVLLAVTAPVRQWELVVLVLPQA